MKKMYLSVAIIVLAASRLFAQLPNCNSNSSIVYLQSDSGRIVNFDPSVPISATNPVNNTIQYPLGVPNGLAVSNNLNSATGPSPTFYMNGGGFFYYYNGTTWVPTSHTCGTGVTGICGAGNVIYGINGSDGSVWKYTGTSNASFLTYANGVATAIGSTDIVADVDGNFYVLKTTAPAWLRKFSPAGTLIKTWTATSLTANAADGMAIIGNKLYYGDANNWHEANIFQNIVIETAASVMFPNSINPGDFASCPLVGTPATPAALCPAFSSYYTNSCTGLAMEVNTNNYTSGMNVKTWYGDGTSSNAPVTSMGTGGYAYFTHLYPTTGAYTVKQVLYQGATPVDSTTYTLNYVFCATQQVRFYLDGNQNCIQDAAEAEIFAPFVTEVSVNGVTQSIIGSTSGFNYLMQGSTSDVFTYKVTGKPAGLAMACPPSGIVTQVLSTTAIPAPITIGLTCPGGGTNFDLSESASAMAGRHAFVTNIVVSNQYCYSPNAQLVMTFSPKYNFYSASIPPNSVVGNTATWNLGLLSQATTPSRTIAVILATPSAWLIPGDTIHTSYSLTPTAFDLNPANNIQARIDTVKASWDPNAISVSPEGPVLPAAKLQYTITFENTGNDTARNIHVMDTLSDHVDINSMRMIGASAPVNVQILQWNGHNIVKFDFPNINLPDSTHQDACHGSVMYYVNLKVGLPFGTVIPNRAGIYFDDNEVVMTNTVTNYIGFPTTIPGESIGNKVQLYPNPTTDQLTIDATITGTATVTDLLGRQLQTTGMTPGKTTISLKSLATGVYLIHISDAQGATETRKLVKQ